MVAWHSRTNCRNEGGDRRNLLALGRLPWPRQFAAKHVGMSTSKRVPMGHPNPQLARVTRMLRRIQPWLQSQRARMATFGEMETWTGVPENTIRGWFASQGNPTAEFMVGLLERAPANVRLEIMDEFCRDYPSLDHPRLSSDRAILSRLATLIRQPRGFTFIQGHNEEARTFVVSALGHSYWTMLQPPRRVLGLDVHAADWFVPVPGVGYLNNILPADELRRAVQPVWPSLRNGEAPLIIFNGLWSGVPEFQEKICAFAERGNVLVADEPRFEMDRRAGRFPVRMTLITVGASAPQSTDLSLEIRAM